MNIDPLFHPLMKTDKAKKNYIAIEGFAGWKKVVFEVVEDSWPRALSDLKEEMSISIEIMNDITKSYIEKNAQFSFVQDRINAMRKRSGCWDLCYCGNLCTIVPRFGDDDPTPQDPLLKGLGSEFHHQFNVLQSEWSSRMYMKAMDRIEKIIFLGKEIEERAVVVINKELSKLDCTWQEYVNQMNLKGGGYGE